MASNSERIVSFGQYAGNPTTKNLTSIEHRGFTLTATAEELRDPSFNGRRTQGQTLDGNVSVAGNLQVSYKPRTTDLLLSNFFRKAWTANKLTHGYGANKADLPIYFHDVIASGTPMSNSYMDCYANTLTVNIADGVNSTLDFGFVGRSHAFNATVPVNTTTPAVSKNPFIHVNCVFKLDGVAIGYMTSFTLNMANNLTPDFVLGTNVADDISAGQFTASGSFTAKAKNASLMTRRFARTKGPLVVEVSNGSEKDIITMPNVFFSNVDSPFDGDGPTMLNVTFVCDPDANNDVVTWERVTITP